MTHSQAVALLVATAVLWSFGGLLIKLVDWHSVAIAGGRSAIAALLFFLVLGKPSLEMSRSQWAAAIAYTATVILFVSATRLTTAANAIFLQYAGVPVYTILLSAWILKEKSSIIDWGAVFLVLGGMVLFFVDGFEVRHGVGNILAILSGVSFALMIVFLRKQGHNSTWEPIFWGNILTALAGLPFMRGPLPDLIGIASLFGLGTFQLGLSYILYTVSIRRVTATEAALVPVIEPILNPVWAFVGLGEMPGVWSIVGGILVLLAVSGRFVLTYRFSRSNPVL